jgi:hypothetical protein
VGEEEVMDLTIILLMINSICDGAILVLLVYWFKFDRKQAKKRPRRPKKEPTVVVQTVIPKEETVA